MKLLKIGLCVLPVLFFTAAASTSFAQSDTSAVLGIFQEVEQLKRTGDYVRAKELLRQADSLSNAIDYSAGLEKAALETADFFIEERELERAVELLNESIRKYPESRQMAGFYNLLASANNYMANFDEAVRLYETALEYTYRLGSDKENRLNAGILHNLATAYQSIGERNKAMENFLLAIEYGESAKDTMLLALAYNNLGMAYNSNDEFEKSIYYLEKSLEYAKAQNSKVDIYRAHLNLANALSNSEQYQAALDNYEVAEMLFVELRPNVPPAIILHNRGSTLAKMGRYKEAEELLNESLALAEEMNIAQGVYFNHHILGVIYFEQGRSEESLYHLEHAVQAANMLSNVDLTQNSREFLYKAYAQAGKFEDAFATLEKHRAVSDSLTDLVKEKELAELESQLELRRQSEINRLLQEKQQEQEQKLNFQMILLVTGALAIVLVVVILFIMWKTAREREIIHAELQKQKEELEKVSQAKDKLFAIVAHDLRTPLSSMKGILFLIKESALSNEEIANLIQELEDSVQKNVDVMEDMLAWAQDQLSGEKMNISSIAVKPVILKVIQSQKLMADKKGIDITEDVHDECKVLADTNALQLIIRNLLSNAIKFTKEGGIRMSCESKADTVIIQIKDTGIGIPEEEASKVFAADLWTRQGTDKEKGSGFGLRLTKEFTERMNGKIWFESEEGRGTSFYVELPSEV